MMRVAIAIVPEVRQLLAEDPSELQALLEEMHDEDIADLVAGAVPVIAALPPRPVAPEPAPLPSREAPGAEPPALDAAATDAGARADA